MNLFMELHSHVSFIDNPNGDSIECVLDARHLISIKINQMILGLLNFLLLNWHAQVKKYKDL